MLMTNSGDVEESQTVDQLTNFFSNSVRQERLTQEVDFEDLVSRQREEDMPQQVIWLAIERKHLNRIARAWTVFCIVVQVISFAVIILIYIFISLFEFENGREKVTPLFYIDSKNKYKWYFSIYDDSLEQCMKTNEGLSACTC